MATLKGRALGFLPLTPAVFDILLALSDSERHGYGIAKEVADRTDGAVRLGPGTLYGTLTRLVDAGLIDDSDRTDSRASGAASRRRYYRLTPLGREVARAEARRLADLVRAARAKLLLSPRRR